MRTKVLLFLLFVITLSALGTLVTVIFNTAPTTREIIALFYLSLIISVFGLTFFAIYGFAALRMQAIPDWQSTLGAFRLGAIVGVFSAITLAIQSVKLLNVATFVILLILALASELILRRRALILKK